MESDGKVLKESCDELLTVPAFLDTLRKISTSMAPDTKFCLFLDGLDEYDGRSLDIIELIDIWKSFRNMKTCVSSRPWNEFEDRFGSDSPWKLYMQDLTRGTSNCAPTMRVLGMSQEPDSLLSERSRKAHTDSLDRWYLSLCWRHPWEEFPVPATSDGGLPVSWLRLERCERGRRCFSLGIPRYSAPSWPSDEFRPHQRSTRASKRDPKIYERLLQINMFSTENRYRP